MSDKNQKSHPSHIEIDAYRFEDMLKSHTLQIKSKIRDLENQIKDSKKDILAHAVGQLIILIIILLRVIGAI